MTKKQDMTEVLLEITTLGGLFRATAPVFIADLAMDDFIDPQIKGLRVECEDTASVTFATHQIIAIEKSKVGEQLPRHRVVGYTAIKHYKSDEP